MIKTLTTIILLAVGVSVLALGYMRRADFLLAAKPNETQETRVEAELLVLRSDGFHPREITRPQGRFLLAVQNHSGVEELALLLRREAGTSVKQLNLTRRQSKFKDFVDLPTGRYLLIDANHEQWSCNIVITAR